MVSTRANGVSPLRSLQSPDFRKRKMPKRKIKQEKNDESEISTQDANDDSATRVPVESVTIYRAPDTASTSTSPQPQATESESGSEPDSHSTSPPLEEHPTHVPTSTPRRVSSTHHEVESQHKKQAIARQSTKFQGPSPNRGAIPATTRRISQSHNEMRAESSKAQKPIPLAMNIMRRASAEGLGMEEFCAQRMKQLRPSIPKPKLVMAKFPGYDEDISSDDEEIQLTKDLGLAKATKFLEREKIKEWRCQREGRIYVAPSPIQDFQHKLFRRAYRKSTASRLSQDTPRIPYIHISNAPGHDKIVLTDPKLIDTIRSLVKYASSSPSKTLPGADEMIAMLENAQSSGQAPIMPVHRTDEHPIDVAAGTASPNPISSNSTTAAVHSPKQTQSKRVMLTPVSRHRPAHSPSTFKHPGTPSDTDDADESNADAAMSYDEDQTVSRSGSEVASPQTSQVPGTPQNASSQVWGFLSAVKNIVSSPSKLFSSSHQAAVAAPTNNQALDLGFQPLTPSRANPRSATPQSATTRRLKQALMARGPQSERKPSTYDEAYVPIHMRGADIVEAGMAKRREELRIQQEKKKAKQRKEDEETHVPRHTGTFCVPDYSSSSEDESEVKDSDTSMIDAPDYESPLAQKKFGGKKSVRFAEEDEVFQLGPSELLVASPEDVRLWETHRPHNGRYSLYSKTKSNTLQSRPLGLGELQTRWQRMGMGIDAFNRRTAAFEANEAQRKHEIAVWARKFRADRNRAEMAQDSEMNEEQAGQDGIIGASPWGAQPMNGAMASVNETQHFIETNPGHTSFDNFMNITSPHPQSPNKAASSRWSVNETQSMNGTNPDNSSVNEIRSTETNPDNVLAEQSSNVGSKLNPTNAYDEYDKSDWYQHKVADDYFSGRDRSRSPYVRQKVNPFETPSSAWLEEQGKHLKGEEAARNAAKVAELRAWEADAPARQARVEKEKAEEALRQAGRQAQEAEAARIAAAEEEARKAEEVRRVALTANANKYTPKTPSNLRTVHNASPFPAEPPREPTQEEMLAEIGNMTEQEADAMLGQWGWRMLEPEDEKFPYQELMLNLVQMCEQKY